MHEALPTHMGTLLNITTDLEVSAVVMTKYPHSSTADGENSLTLLLPSNRHYNICSSQIHRLLSNSYSVAYLNLLYVFPFQPIFTIVAR